jgi:uncharacterized protein YjbJ (UPF0337 family)
MKRSAEDKIKGTLHVVKGTVKAKMGQATNTPSLTVEGKSEKLGGRVQRKIGELERIIEK